MGEPWFKLFRSRRTHEPGGQILELRTVRRNECPRDELLGRYSAWVEVYSIDEAFLGIRGTLDELQALG